MANGIGGLLAALSDGKTVILSREVAILGVGGRMRRLDQRSAQPRTAFTGATTQALARAFIVARTHARPRGEMPGTGDAAHVRSDLGEDDFGQAPLDAWDGLQTLEVLLKRPQARRNLLAQMRNSLIEAVDMSELLPDQEAMMGREPSL